MSGLEELEEGTSVDAEPVPEETETACTVTGLLAHPAMGKRWGKGRATR